MKKYLRLFPYIFYGLLGVFLFIYLSNINYSSLCAIQIDTNFILFALIIGLISRFWLAIIWLAMLARLGAKRIHHNYPVFFMFLQNPGWVATFPERRPG